MADLDTGDAGYLFKLLAEQKLDDDALKRNNPLVKWMPSETDFTSHRGKEVSIEYTTAQGMGATEAIASSTANPSKGTVFLVPQRHWTHNAGLQRVVLQNAAAGGSDSEFADAMVNELDGVTQQFGNQLERQAWGTSSGVRGVVAVGTASPITLTDIATAQLFEIGQSFSAIDPSGDALRVGTGVVSGINRTTGVITYTGTITALAVGDYLIGLGDGGNELSVPGNFAFDGIQGWCPVTPSASFLGVNQTTDRERIAGIYTDQSTASIRNAFIAAQAITDLMSGLALDQAAPLFCNPLNYAEVEMSVEASKVNAMSLKEKYGIGLEGISVGSMNFVKAAFCPVNHSFKIGKGAFIRGSSGKQPKLNNFNADGSAYVYDPATGTLKFTMSHDGNVYSRRPYHIMRVKVRAQTVLA